MAGSAAHRLTGRDRAVGYLPAPPSDEERIGYVHRGLTPLLVGAAISTGTLVASQVQFTAMSSWLLVFLPVFAFCLASYVISTVVNLGTRPFALEPHDELVRRAQRSPHPSVDVFLPVCGESVGVLLNSWRHIAQMAEHYPGRIEVHVLDDSPSPSMAPHAAALGFTYHRRPDRGWYKKAGNLRYGYGRTSAELILVLDADFAPRPDLLQELVPYFAVEPRLGIVQSPQFFRVRPEQGWLERGAGAVQELFYRLVQVSRQQHGAAICVGSCAVYRRAALDEIGGTTLIEHSEDVHTGFDLRRRGWTLRYLPLPLAAGLCPPDLISFLNQQYRWCVGSMSLLGSAKFWATPMALRARFSYLSGFAYYLQTAILTLVGPLVPIVMLSTFPGSVQLRNYLLLLPSLVYTFVVFPAWHRCSYRVEAWTAKLVYGWAHSWALWDLVRRRPLGWQSTGGVAPRARSVRLQVGIGVWSVGTALAWTSLAVHRMLQSDPLAFAPAFVLGAFYLAVALQALLVNPVVDLRVRAPAAIGARSAR